MVNDIIKMLREAGVSSRPVEPTVWVDTGSYALNWVISGKYNRGLPIGCMIQVKGDASTAKSVFVASILGSAQKKGYHVALADAENTLSPDFASHFGLDTENLIYCDPTSVPPSIEGTFEWLAKVISTIREADPEDTTPIILALDSLPVLSPEKEFEEEKDKKKVKKHVVNHVQQNTDGMIRAKLIGGGLRKINGLLGDFNATLLIVNQIRTKINVWGPASTTDAAGGKGLGFYLSVDLETVSTKTVGGPIYKDNKKTGEVIGQRGEIRCKKNKVALPSRKCGWELHFNKGLNSFYGLLECLVHDGIATQSGSWYTINGKKFQEEKFYSSLKDLSVKELDPLRNLLDINLQREA